MDYERRKFQSDIEDAAACSGAGTELVTVWIPPGKNLNTVRSRLRGEAAEAENIKSKSTRERVVGALERALNILHKYNTVPENGLVLCSGYLESVDDYVTFEYNDLPKPIRDSKYECSDEFAIDELWEMAFGGSEWWGLITITRDSASIGKYTNINYDYVDVIECFTSQVMGKSKAGGQSQARFARVREEQRDNHYKKAAKIAKESFDSDNDGFQGLALAGPKVSVNDFIDFLPSRLEESIVTIESIDHAGSRESLTALAESAEEAFSQQEKQEERALVKEFKKRLSNDESVAYGDEEIDTAIEYGAVDTLLLSADFNTDYIDSLTERVRNQGGDVKIISTMHEEGQQLEEVFGGVVALLRFDTN